MYVLSQRMPLAIRVTAGNLQRPTAMFFSAFAIFLVEHGATLPRLINSTTRNKDLEVSRNG